MRCVNKLVQTQICPFLFHPTITINCVSEIVSAGVVDELQELSVDEVSAKVNSRRVVRTKLLL